ncbi:gamma-glutamylcyclotransferase [Oceanibium sediminis]|uniref:gamma-glutamylcyclotransferase n=1 Tax=Oceanibium sediminis TaxID=2026339 RepID=UPI000DD2C6ED|nr:gamma-glutamylcyclotransferase [Oceanibium sediminis]
MTDSTDPFRHHPSLRALVKDPETSFFRDFRPCDLDARMAELGKGPEWRFPQDQIDASRDAFLERHGEGPLWVFGYGSLMWDPGFAFDEVRRARITTYRRRFCLRDTLGARGTPEAPGLMVALDTGGPCEGLVFRIPPHALLREATSLWNRELVAPAYHPVMTEAETALGPLPTLAFVADHSAPDIVPDIPYADQIRFAATGTGFLGTSMEYLENIAAHLDEFGIEDAEVKRLLRDARAYVADREVGQPQNMK